MDVEVSRSEPPDWNDLVSSDPLATFFHRTEWSRALCDAGLGAGVLYLCVREAGTLTAGIPAVSVQRGPLRIVSSMPHGTYGGIVYRDGEETGSGDALLDAIADLASGISVAAVHLMDEAARVRETPRGFDRREERAHRISLEQGYDAVWAGFRPSARNKVRKAEKAGVAVRRAESESDFLEYHDMLLECSERWGEECVFGRNFFASLAVVGPPMVEMWLAEHEGKTIGGDLNFVLHGRVMNWGNVSRGSARKLAPNNLLHASAMRAGAEEGHTVYDLGSSAGIEGVDAFKSAFGTTLVPLAMYSSLKPWYRAARTASRLPKGGGRR